MANKVLLKKSSVSAKVPLTADLDYGEVALNYNDAKLFFKKSDGTTIDHFPSTTSTSTLSNKTLLNPIVTAAASTVALQINRVSGQPSIKSGGTDGYLIMDNTTGLGGALGINWYSSDKVVIALGGGNVGLGTSDPLYKLHVVDGGSTMWFRDNGTASEIVLKSETGGTSALYFGDGADDIRGGILYDSTANMLKLHGYNNSNVLNINASGDIGFGMTPQAWSTGWNAFDIAAGDSGYIAGFTDNSFQFGTNSYYNASWKYSQDGLAANYYQQNGEHVFRTAVTGLVDAPLSWTDVARINNNGNFGLGIATAVAPIHVYRSGLTTGIVDMLRLEGNLSDVVADPLALGLLFRIKDGNNVGAEARIRMVAVNDTDYNTGAEEDNAHLIISLTNTSGVATDRLILNSLGNMGLGTLTPTAQIDLGSTYYAGTPSTVAQNLNKLVLYSSSATAYYGFGVSTSSLNIIAGEPAGKIRLMTGGATERVVIASNGNVGIDVTSPIYRLHVNGSFAATTKSFVIPHPTKENKFLRYGSLEGPENGVYVRGRLKDGNTIELPEYWTKLVDPDSITVELTPIGSHQKLYVKDISDNKVVVGNENVISKSVNCFYTVYAERVDVEKLEVEIDGN